MKNWYIIGCLISLSCLQCSKDEDILFRMQFDVNVTMFPATNTAITFHTPVDNIRSGIQDILDDNGVTLEDIDVIRTRSAVILPVGHRFSYAFLRKIEVNIFPQGDPFDLLPIAEEIPRLEQEPGEMDMLPGLPNVKEYVGDNFFGLDVAYILRTPLNETLQNVVRVEFEAVAK